jgi:hypothetical protein
MDQLTYQEELRAAQAVLAPLSDHASIAGDGNAMFLSVSREARGVELYRHGDRVLIDTAIDGQLLGERDFTSIDAAVEAAKRWLSGTNE